MKEKLDEIDLFIFIGLFILTIYVNLTSCLNPFGLAAIDSDTSVYLTIARGITEGKVPYRDFFDNKGPLLYLLSVPGMFLGRFTGVWITGLIFVGVSVFFAYKTSLFFADRFSAFFGVVFSFIVFKIFYYEVAGADYAIPFMIISLYIFTKYYFKKTEPSIIELITLGICFSSSILIRINLFPLWLGFCLGITAESIIKRNFSSLFRYILWFITGIIIIFIPIVLYLYINNALLDYLIQNLVVGSSRGLQDSSIRNFAKSFFTIIGKNYSFTPLLIGSLWIIKYINTKQLFYYICFTLSFFFSVFFLAIIGTNYDHYNMVLVPYFVPAFSFFIQNIFNYLNNLKYKKAAVVFFLCIVFSGEILSGISYSITQITSRSREEYIDLGKIIDQNTVDGDEIISLGINRRIYLFTNRSPASRFIYQLSGAQYYNETIPEFLSDIISKRPAVIVIRKDNDRYDYLPEWYSPIYEMIKKDYYILTDAGNYFLFKKYE